VRALVVVAALVPALGRAEPKPSKAMCDAKVIVDRVDDVMQCSGSDTRRFVATSVRGDSGWHEPRENFDFPFSSDESGHADVWLAEALRRICAGDDNRELRWASLHTRELGYPLDACRSNQRSLVLHKGKASFAIERPRVDELWEMQRMLHLHAFGKQLVWKTAPTKTM
jgi:hypothetical protein